MEEIFREIPALNKWFDELYGPKLAEAEAKLKRELERHLAATEKAQAKLRQSEAKRREAEAKRREAEVEIEVIRREAVRREAEAKAEAKAQVEAKAKAEWLETAIKFLAYRFPKTPIKVALDLQRVSRVSGKQRLQVIDLILDAPDLATFRKELKAKVSAVSSQ